MRILGIDPGSAIMGFGVIDSAAGQLAHVAHGTLRPPRSLKLKVARNPVWTRRKACPHDQGQHDRRDQL